MTSLTLSTVSLGWAIVEALPELSGLYGESDLLWPGRDKLSTKLVMVDLS